MARKYLLDCDEHGPRQACVVVCRHVLAGAAPAEIEWPPDDGSAIGQIVCHRDHGGSFRNDAVCMCVGHARALLSARSANA